MTWIFLDKEWFRNKKINNIVISFLVFPEKLQVKKFKNNVPDGTETCITSNLKHGTAQEKPVYICTNSDGNNVKYIFFRPMPLGWSLGTKTILDGDVSWEGDPRGFRSKGNMLDILND